MILFLRSSLRSLWTPVVVSVGLTFALLGAITAAPEPGAGIDIAALVLGVVIAGFGLAFAWGGLRMGVVRCGSGLRIRELFGGETYTNEQIRGFDIGEDDHDTVPLTIIFPTIQLTDGEEIRVTALATFRVLPGAVRQTRRAADKMAAWTGKGVAE